MRAAHFKFFMGPYTTIVNKREQISKLTGSRQAPRFQLSSSLHLPLPTPSFSLLLCNDLQRKFRHTSQVVGGRLFGWKWRNWRQQQRISHMFKRGGEERGREKGKVKGVVRREGGTKLRGLHKRLSKHNKNIKQRRIKMKLSCAIKAKVEKVLKKPKRNLYKISIIIFF